MNIFDTALLCRVRLFCQSVQIEPLSKCEIGLYVHVCSNFQAPVTAELDRGINVLDVGCGSGTWTIACVSNQFSPLFFIGIHDHPEFAP
ncbi:hypothetical protein BC938DRAFT_483202 [Jimgerdemannia flammicorona]|uniref:Methyltransferase domain-containing protein n=1 Tax=Jimgerdemannia flammicorona TaxID=994334 RepID=A0A433QCH0_9FUNG|nr:hypothetical protein BC938DRAFT_483202 [Jimgerdemannia flammicorona]